MGWDGMKLTLKVLSISPFFWRIKPLRKADTLLPIKVIKTYFGRFEVTFCCGDVHLSYIITTDATDE